MFSDDVKIYFNNCRLNPAPIFNDEQRGKVIDALMGAGALASPGFRFTISGPETSHENYLLEVISLNREEIHLNWIRSK